MKLNGIIMSSNDSPFALGRSCDLRFSNLIIQIVVE